MDDKFRTERRAEWQARTPLATRWVLSILAFVAIMIIFVLIAVL
jgi:hypothetical protein